MCISLLPISLWRMRRNLPWPSHRHCISKLIMNKLMEPINKLTMVFTVDLMPIHSQYELRLWQYKWIFGHNVWSWTAIVAMEAKCVLIGMARKWVWLRSCLSFLCALWGLVGVRRALVHSVKNKWSFLYCMYLHAELAFDPLHKLKCHLKTLSSLGTQQSFEPFLFLW